MEGHRTWVDPTRTTFHVWIESTMRWRCSIIRLTLVVLTCSVFLQTWKFEFVHFDDDVYVYENPHVLSGLTAEGIAWAFSGRSREPTANWFPLTWLSLMLDSQIYGNKPGGYHLTSVLLHMASVLLLFGVLRRMTGANWKSAFVAALFAVHPLRVESVAWVSERKDVLSVFFGLVSVWAYVKFVGRKYWGWYLLALAGLALSLLSKQTLVTLPFVLLLLDWWPLRRCRSGQARSAPTTDAATVQDHAAVVPETNIFRQTWTGLVCEKLPFLLLTVAFCGIALMSQQTGESVASLEQFSFAQRLSNATVVCVIYFAKTVWPWQLAVYYPLPDSIPMLDVAGSALLLVSVTGIAVAVRSQHPYLLFGWLLYLGTLIPVIGLVQIGGQRMADRYTYFPLIGLFVAATWLIPALAPIGLWRRCAVPGLGAIVLAVFAAMAWRQTAFWKDSVSLFEHTLAVTKENNVIHNNLAVVFFKQQRLDRAIWHYQQAIKIEARDITARLNLASALSALGRIEESIEQYQAAVKLDTRNVSAYNNLGYLLCEQGRYGEALRPLQSAVAIDPSYAAAFCNLGFARIGLNQFGEAEQCFRTAVQNDPNLSIADEDIISRHVRAGAALAAEGKLLQAEAQFRRAFMRMPDHMGAEYRIGLERLAAGDWNAAQIHLATAHNKLGEQFVARGKWKSAVEHFRMALRVKPDLEAARSNLQRASED